MHSSSSHFRVTVEYGRLCRQSKGKQQHTTQQLLPPLRKASGGTAGSQIFGFLPTAWETGCVVTSSTQEQDVTNDSVLPIAHRLLLLFIDVCTDMTQACLLVLCSPVVDAVKVSASSLSLSGWARGLPRSGDGPGDGESWWLLMTWHQSINRPQEAHLWLVGCFADVNPTEKQRGWRGPCLPTVQGDGVPGRVSSPCLYCSPTHCLSLMIPLLHQTCSWGLFPHDSKK